MAKLIECVPNFSCSSQQDPEVFAALVETAEGVPGCTLLDTHSDGDHHRCVLTLIGTPKGVEEAAFRLIAQAVQRIDLNRHTGGHPRMGAADVVPLVPMSPEVDMQECAALARSLGQRVWRELEVPVYLYEDAASAPHRRDLAAVRRGQFEGLEEKMAQPQWAPDFGASRPHPTAGATAIGARKPLVAFNVDLATDDVEVARKIARAIRGSSGGFRGCKAIGLLLPGQGRAQVSMNMVDCDQTPIYMVYEQIRALARRYGTDILDSELVGLTPAKAMLDCAEFYLRMKDFRCKEQVIEYRLLEQGL